MLAAVPRRVDTVVDTHVPVFALGPYAEAHRGVILAAKERGNLAVRRLVGAVIGAGVRHLQAAGELTHDVVLVPAPTRQRSARLRGGDPVSAFCHSSGLPAVDLLRLDPATADQTGLGASGRRANMAGRVRLHRAAPGSPVVLVDDVVTTGATLAASVERLLIAGATVQAALVVAAA
ncbi:ComF family protein [Corynebacterium doosanense]|uniref:ComF family protein n=1 Tax=Corynebacterium doosanense TaxID=1121358 RepID=UPI001FE02331|nr:ComF family protein [Corynebacterium doosanense]